MEQELTRSKGKVKDKYVSFRLLLAEVEDLKSLAQAKNQNVSVFIREKIFARKTEAA